MSIQATESGERSTELELGVRDRGCFFVAASAAGDCRVELEELVGRSDGRLLEFFTVHGTTPERVRELSAEAPAIDEARLLRSDGDHHLFGFVVSGPCVTVTLADAGAVTRSVTAAHGEGRVVADVPAHVDVRSVVETFRERHADSELVARRQRDRPVGAGESGLLDLLTARQREVLRTAYLAGYFEWPRESDAATCAAALDISQPTFSQHLRTGQRRLFGALFDDGRGR